MEPLGSKPLRRAACRSNTQQRKRLQSCSDTESCSAKRLRRSRQADLCPHSLCLYVRWHSTSGGVKITRLPLNPIGGVADLRGLFRRLIQGAFGSPTALPDYLTSPSFYKFAPAEELISLPADIARTEFRLAVMLDGWEYTVCERTLPGTPDPERRLLVTLAEFESEPVLVGDRRYVARLLSYPTVCVARAFLDTAVARVAARGGEQLCGAGPGPLPTQAPA